MSARPKTPQPPKLPKAPKAGRVPLATRAVNQNLTITDNDVIAWFLLPGQPYSFLSEAQRGNLVATIANRYAALLGHRIYIRSTTRPYPGWQWGENLWDNTLATTREQDLPGCPGNTYSDHLVRTQRHLQDVNMSDKAVYLGVRISTRSSLGKLTEFFTKSSSGRELADLQLKAQRIAQIVEGPGMSGRPATGAEVEFLFHRSYAMGMPAPVALSEQTGQWTDHDMGEFVASVTHVHGMGRDTVVAKARRGDRDIERHVAVMSVGRMDSVQIPAASPWMQATDRLHFPVEWMATFDLVRGEDARNKVNRRLRRIRDQQSHYANHGEEIPLDLERKADRARVIEDEMTDGNEVVAGRAYGWVRIAVHGKDRDQCLDRVREVRELYRGMQITVEHPYAAHSMGCQYDLMREFVPGEPLSTVAFQRDFTLQILAGGLPTVSAKVGDRRGPYIGFTSGTSRYAVMFDPHYALEQQASSGLVPIVGGLGAGKSGLLGFLCYESARRNILTTILDPSGPLAKLASMPEFRGRAMVLDLLKAPDGTLNPYSVIETPHAENYVGDTTGYATAIAEAESDRAQLAMDIIQMLLPPQEVDQHGVIPAIYQAIYDTPARPTSSLNLVVENLIKQGSEQAKMVANYLRNSAKMPQSRLFFGTAEEDFEINNRSATLLVITMAGLDLPETGSDRRYWSSGQRMSVPLLHLANYFVTRRVYGQQRHLRKVVALDEVGQMGEWGSGKALFSRLGRDSRKWNTAIFVSSQDPKDVLGLNIANKNSGCFVGRIEDTDIATQALELLRAPKDAGYESVLAGLSPLAAGTTRNRTMRDFVFRDVHGAMERCTIDMSHVLGLIDAIDTDAKPEIQNAPRQLSMSAEMVSATGGAA